MNQLPLNYIGNTKFKDTEVSIRNLVLNQEKNNQTIHTGSIILRRK